jgi:hypothetical protein
MKRVHPLRKWLDHNDMTCPELEKLSGVKACTIRYMCSFKPLSVKKYRALSVATGIPAVVLIFPEDHADFDISDCKSNIDQLSEKCPGL